MNINHSKVVVIFLITIYLSSCAFHSKTLIPVFKDNCDFDIFMKNHFKENPASIYVVINYFNGCFITILSFVDTKSDSIKVMQWDLLRTSRGIDINNIDAKYYYSSLTNQEMISIIKNVQKEEICQPFFLEMENPISLAFFLPNDSTYQPYSVLLSKVLYDNCKELKKIFEILEYFTIGPYSTITHNQSDSLNIGWELDMFLKDTTFLILPTNKILESDCNDCKKHKTLERLASEWESIIVDLELTERNDYQYLLSKTNESKMKCDTASQVQDTNQEVLFSSFTDSRDGQSYKIVRIGNQTWMAENLNYNTGNSLCYNYSSFNCCVYGRLYDWRSAYNACPVGWKLPAKSDFDTLIQNLHVSNGDLYYDRIFDECMDLNGLYGGALNEYGEFASEGKWGIWWSETDMNRYNKWSLWLNRKSKNLDLSGADIDKRSLSIRCIKE